ncbi:enoyl-CoA hydratase-related protein [Hydrogenophaga palleronii]|uniref:enoyl-CoA hydratase-related protein n=1 Tax=Hydrogenophaga palleronii TaxID=65655 RepID=UPI0008261576|nr:enoyl-CoA hydratase-related protein [Hydrogenophaga palleronii]
MSAPAVLFDVVDGIATLTLNEASQMNPISVAMRQTCLQLVERVRDDGSVRALILTGSGGAFCSGARLSDFHPDRPADPERSTGRVIGDMMADAGNPLVSGLRSLRVPVVCAVNGAAAGGGVGLALAADVVIAARSAFFYLPFAPALGLVPDMGASWVLPRAVSRARAMGLTLLGNRLSAQDAADWGLVWACVDDAELSSTALGIAQRLARLPGHAIEEVRALYEQSEDNTFEEQLALERDRQMTLADRPAFAEGVRAFLEKRQPRFRDGSSQL